MAKTSKLMKLFQAFWAAQETDGRSYQRLNGALQTLMRIAIESGVPFVKGDFAAIKDKFRGDYWYGSEDGEFWYSQAAELNHISCCQDFEQWNERPPFIFEGKRLHIGSFFPWEGEQVKVTSFGDDHRGHYLGCCTYHKRDPQKYSPPKVKGRTKVYLDELRKGERAKEPPKPEALLTTFIRVFSDNFSCGIAKDYLRKQKTIKDAYMNCGEREWYSLKGFILNVLKIEVPYHVAESWRTADDVRAGAGDFDTVLLPRLKEVIAQRKAEMKAKKQPAEVPA